MPPLIGQSAPAFRADSTQGPVSFPDDYRGRWVILFSHPGDFTPVCTSELMLFGAMQNRFAERNCQLLGLSVGSVASHIAWLHAIREKIVFRGISNLEIKFPLLEDLSMDISRAYGMIHPRQSGTKTVRTVFFIDPEGVIRASLNYPMALGRNMEEIMRILVGLQTVDEYSVALPADWHPGQPVIVPAAATFGSGQPHNHNPQCCDWFFCLKNLDDKPEGPEAAAAE